MDICTLIGYEDVRWKKVYSAPSGGYVETFVLNGQPELHMTVILKLDPTFVDQYCERMESYVKKRLREETPIAMGIDMRHTHDFNIETQKSFIQKIGQIHERLYEKDERYTQFILKRVFIIMPNPLVAAALKTIVDTFFNPLVPFMITASEKEVVDVFNAG